MEKLEDKKEVCPQSQTDLVAEIDYINNSFNAQAQRRGRRPLLLCKCKVEGDTIYLIIRGKLAKTIIAIKDSGHSGMTHLEAAKGYDLIHFDKHLTALRKLPIPLTDKWVEREDWQGYTVRFKRYFLTKGFQIIAHLGGY